MVSAQQLADISWSAVFDDVELNAEEIERLASEARPLVESKGQWIELDKITKYVVNFKLDIYEIIKNKVKKIIN